MSVNAPMWLAIKVNSCCKDGATHIFQMISRFWNLSADLKEIADPVIKRNYIFVHPENILIAVITDDTEHVCELGLRGF